MNDATLPRLHPLTSNSLKEARRKCRENGARSFGFCRTSRWDQIDPPVAKALLAAIEHLKTAGAQRTLTLGLC